MMGDPNKIILVGDVGGTNVRLGLAERNNDRRIIVTQFFKIKGDDVGSLEGAIEKFLEETHFTPKHVSIALAGPVKDGAVDLTNRPWHVSEDKLKTLFGFSHVRLYNDFKAMARSVPEMREDDFRSISHGIAVSGDPILVAGAGTGFGVAKLVNLENKWHVFGSEGGHVAFSPKTRDESEILHILQRKHDYVSLELVTSGWGMDCVHEAICLRDGKTYSLTPPARILELAAENDPIALEICELRSAVIMGALGDMSVVLGAKGGVVLAGGVSERLIDYIDTPKAKSRFFNRGPISNYVKNIPIRLLENPAAPLMGAAALYEQEHAYNCLT